MANGTLYLYTSRLSCLSGVLQLHFAFGVVWHNKQFVRRLSAITTIDNNKKIIKLHLADCPSAQ